MAGLILQSAVLGLLQLRLRIAEFLAGLLRQAAHPRFLAWAASRRYAIACRVAQSAFGPLENLVMRTRVDLHPSQVSIAQHCDLSITQYGAFQARADARTIFVKADPYFLLQFYREYYPRLAGAQRFVLITGSSDRTIPRQVDLRSPSYAGTRLEGVIRELLADPRLAAWYAENCDLPSAKMIPIPIGYLGWDGDRLYQQARQESGALRLRDRPLRAICAQRVRPGEQWDKRRRVSALAAGAWAGCVDLHDSIEEDRFVATLQRYPFTICVTGGGLDPSPKAWAALLAGSIPVIERTPGSEAYAELPVAYVESWEQDSISVQTLSAWIAELGRFYEEPELRAAVVEKLGMRYWWRKMTASLG